MKIKHLFDLKKIFIKICNLKYYISGNLFSLIGWFDFIFFSWLREWDKGDTTGIGFVFGGTIYLGISRIVVLLILLLLLIEKIKKIKIKQNSFMNNIIFNIIFCLGLIPFTVLSLFVLYIILLFIKMFLFETFIEGRQL